jgi:hypothetical protein
MIVIFFNIVYKTNICNLKTLQFKLSNVIHKTKLLIIITFYKTYNKFYKLIIIIIIIMIPKNIFFYWDKDIPNEVTNNIAYFKENNLNYNVVLLNDNDIDKKSFSIINRTLSFSNHCCS